jgi:dTDP-4-dehydrorhamnose reductase
MANLLVIGRSGQLARALMQSDAPGLSVLALGRDVLDLNEPGEIGRKLEDAGPAAVINAAAYNAVDRAEADAGEAMRINAEAVGALAAACARLGIPLVHVSTDYVFAGDKGAPYVESDPTGPLNAYGRSKLAGERAALAAAERIAVVRTSWVHSAGGNGFVQTMLRLARERGAVDLVADQFGRPTWAPDLAAATLHLARALLDHDASAQGLFHYSGTGDASRADWGEWVLACAARQGGPSAELRRVVSADFFTAAPRPRDTRLDCPRFAGLPGAPALRDWREGVERCVAEMAAVT